jgi:hypothetical protein
VAAVNLALALEASLRYRRQLAALRTDPVPSSRAARLEDMARAADLISAPDREALAETAALLRAVAASELGTLPGPEIARDRFRAIWEALARAADRRERAKILVLLHAVISEATGTGVLWQIAETELAVAAAFPKPAVIADKRSPE